MRRVLAEVLSTARSVLTFEDLDERIPLDASLRISPPPSTTNFSSSRPHGR